MRDIEDLEQAMALLRPKRLEILKRLDDPAPARAAVILTIARKIITMSRRLKVPAWSIKLLTAVRAAFQKKFIRRARAHTGWPPSLVGQIGSISRRKIRQSASIAELAEE